MLSHDFSCSNMTIYLRSCLVETHLYEPPHSKGCYILDSVSLEALHHSQGVPLIQEKLLGETRLD